jgi:hypothetical protein
MPDIDPIVAALAGIRQYPADDPINGLTYPSQMPKPGMTLPPVSTAPQPGQVMQGIGDLTGVNDAVKALRGQMTPEEAQTFALGAVPMLFGGPEAKAAEDVAPAIARGIRAYHGSPHDFDAFDLSQIGTGQGAQSFGHGLYFAEAEPAAKSYRDSLSDLKDHQVEGTDYTLPSWAAKSIASKNPIAINDLRTTFQNRLADMQAGIDNGTDQQPWVTQSNIEGLKKILAGVNSVEQGAHIKPPGRMYEVNINADPDHFLDWDAPLNEQHPKVQDAVKQAMGIDYYGKFDPQKSERLWNEFSNAQAGTAVRQGFIASDDALVSDRLHQAGIPGIKYLDQGSRNQTTWVARHPQGGVNDFPNESQAQAFIAKNPEYSLEPPKQTRNYVVFNDKLIDLVKKYGIAGAAGTGATAASVPGSPPTPQQ